MPYAGNERSDQPYAHTQSDHGHRCSLIKGYYELFQQTDKALIRLQGEAELSWPSQLEYGIRHLLACWASNIQVFLFLFLVFVVTVCLFVCFCGGFFCCCFFCCFFFLFVFVFVFLLLFFLFI